MFKSSTNARRFATGALATIMATGAIAAPIVAGAAPTNAGTLSVTKAGKGKYKVYAILSADSVADGKLSNAGVTANEDAVVKVLTEKGLIAAGTYHKTDSEAVRANVISDALAAVPEARRAEVANAIAKELVASGTATGTYTPVDGKLDVTGLKTGYYLVASDTTDADGWAETSMTDAMLIPLGADGVTKDSKISVPTVKKEVDQAKVSENGLLDGVALKNTYKITGTMPVNIDQFDKYEYTFKDTLPNGVNVTQAELATWNVSIKTADGVNLTDKFTATVTAGDNDNSVITWTCEDLKAATTLTKDTKVIVEYTPVFDEHDVNALFNQASALSTPQVNKVDLTYSNSPYSNGKGHTPEDSTKVYSYNLVIKKVKEDQQALTGARFTLTDADGKTVGKDITVGDDGTFNFTGLKAGVEYTITETTVPSGYKAIAPVKFTIAETKDAENNAVESISATESSDPSNAAVFTTSDATVNATIVNVPGQNMFQTGQAGIITGVMVGSLALTLSVVTIIKRRNEQAAA